MGAGSRVGALHSTHVECNAGGRGASTRCVGEGPSQPAPPRPPVLPLRHPHPCQGPLSTETAAAPHPPSAHTGGSTHPALTQVAAPTQHAHLLGIELVIQPDELLTPLVGGHRFLPAAGPVSKCAHKRIHSEVLCTVCIIT